MQYTIHYIIERSNLKYIHYIHVIMSKVKIVNWYNIKEKYLIDQTSCAWLDIEACMIWNVDA